MEFDTYLPDQPTLISFKPNLASREVVITVGRDVENFISVKYDEFMIVMIKEARLFFEKIVELLPERESSYIKSLNRLDSIQVVEKTN